MQIVQENDVVCVGLSLLGAYKMKYRTKSRDFVRVGVEYPVSTLDRLWGVARAGCISIRIRGVQSECMS